MPAVFMRLSIICPSYIIEDSRDIDSIPSLCEIHSKTVAAAFWTHQLERELRESGMDDHLYNY